MRRNKFVCKTQPVILPKEQAISVADLLAYVRLHPKKASDLSDNVFVPRARRILKMLEASNSSICTLPALFTDLIQPVDSVEKDLEEKLQIAQKMFSRPADLIPTHEQGLQGGPYLPLGGFSLPTREDIEKEPVRPEERSLLHGEEVAPTANSYSYRDEEILQLFEEFVFQNKERYRGLRTNKEMRLQVTNEACQALDAIIVGLERMKKRFEDLSEMAANSYLTEFMKSWSGLFSLQNSEKINFLKNHESKGYLLPLLSHYNIRNQLFRSSHNHLHRIKKLAQEIQALGMRHVPQKERIEKTGFLQWIFIEHQQFPSRLEAIQSPSSRFQLVDVFPWIVRKVKGLVDLLAQEIEQDSLHDQVAVEGELADSQHSFVEVPDPSEEEDRAVGDGWDRIERETVESPDEESVQELNKEPNQEETKSAETFPVDRDDAVWAYMENVRSRGQWIISSREQEDLAQISSQQRKAKKKEFYKFPVSLKSKGRKAKDQDQDSDNDGKPIIDDFGDLPENIQGQIYTLFEEKKYIQLGSKGKRGLKVYQIGKRKFIIAKTKNFRAAFHYDPEARSHTHFKTLSGGGKVTTHRLLKSIRQALRFYN